LELKKTMKHLVVLSLLSCFVGGDGVKTLIGSSLCTRGPGHWCQNKETAANCDALLYCQQKIWKADDAPIAETVQSVPLVPIAKSDDSVPMVKINQAAHSTGASSGAICTYCEEIVNYAKIILGNPDAQTEIKVLFEGMCDQLGPLKETCKEFINNNIAKIIQTISHADTKTVCVELHMCDPNSHILKSQSPIRTSLCSKCKSFALDVLENLQTSKSMSDLAVSFCDKMGRSDLLCHHHVGLFLASARVAGTDSYFCSFICKDGDETFCPAVQAPVEIEDAPSSATDQPPACLQCIQALTMLKKQITGQIACLKKKLEKYCDVVPPLAPECKAAVEGFFKPLQEQIDQLDPNVTCVQIGVCNPTEMKLVSSSSPELCVYCEQTVNYAKIIMGKPGFEANVEQVLLDLCEKLGPLKGGCKQYVEDNLQEIFNQLKNIDTKTICNGFGFCKASLFSSPSAILPLGILGGIDRPKLPFIPHIDTDVAAIARDHQEDDGVIRIKSKKDTKKSPLPMVKKDERVVRMKHVTSSEEQELPQMSCFTCKFVMGEGIKVLGEDSTVDQIASLVETVCNDLNGDLKAQCSDFLSLYAKEYIHLAIKQLNAENICELMGACEASYPGPDQPHGPGNPILCFGCEKGLQKIVELWRKDPIFQEKVHNVMQSVCLRLPDHSSMQECVDEVDVVFPIFSQLVINMNPKQACTNAGVCASKLESGTARDLMMNTNRVSLT